MFMLNSKYFTLFSFTAMLMNFTISQSLKQTYPLKIIRTKKAPREGVKGIAWVEL